MSHSFVDEYYKFAAKTVHQAKSKSNKRCIVFRKALSWIVAVRVILVCGAGARGHCPSSSRPAVPSRFPGHSVLFSPAIAAQKPQCGTCHPIGYINRFYYICLLSTIYSASIQLFYTNFTLLCVLYVEHIYCISWN